MAPITGKVAFGRFVRGLTSPWSIGFSAFGLAYGAYHIWDMTQSGSSYELDADLTGKTYIVTGATSGIGQQTVEELAKRNARVIMACRNREKCVKVRRDIVLSTRNKQVYCRQCNMNDFESIRSFVTKLSQGKFQLDRIDGVVHNAATMEPERSVNKDGIENTLATNYLGPFLLTALLLNKLLSQEDVVRLVFLNTNIIERNCSVNFDDLNSEQLKKWDGFKVYKQSKLAQAMFAKELSERLKGTNIRVTVADPGRTKTSLTQKLDGHMFFISRWLLNAVGFVMGQRRVEKAVRPVLFALADEQMQSANGVFIDRERNEQKWADAVMQKDDRDRLWLTSIKWTNLLDHFAKLKADVQMASSDLQQPQPALTEPTSGRSWKTLWLW